MKVCRPVQAVVLALAMIPSAPLAGAEPNPDALRLLPSVLIKGDPGASLEERMRSEKVPAVSIAIIRDFKVVWAKAYGMADSETGQKNSTETLFQAASISKSVAAAGVLKKTEDGTLTLDRDVNTYLKSWKLPENELTAKRKVTLAMLLNHSGGTTVHGFPGYAPGDRIPTIPQVLDGRMPANTAPVRVTLEPDTQWRYSGGGVTVAQLVMTDVTGRPYPALLESLVLAPAGMSHSTYEQPLPPAKLALAAAGHRPDGTDVPGKRHTYPEMAAAGLWTTPTDLARFAIAIQESWRGDPGSLLKKETARRMVTPHLGDYGLGFEVYVRRGDTYFEHSGSNDGFRAQLVAHREKGYGAAVMVNSDNGEIIGEIVRGIAKEYGWDGYLPDPVATVPLSPDKAAACAGRFALNGDEVLTLTVRGARLFGRPVTGDEYELLPIGEDTFVRRDRETRYVFEPAAGGNLFLVAGKERVVARRVGDDFRVPSELLAEGRTAEAVAQWRALRMAKPDDAGVAEGRLNGLGYDLAGRKEFAKAIAVLRLNTELYPDSANTYDSLGEVLVRIGDKAQGLATYRRVLDVLPKDTKADPGLRETLRKNAERNIRDLSVP
jgi:CubicO group peptidase (beta-lactamase class C family)